MAVARYLLVVLLSLVVLAQGQLEGASQSDAVDSSRRVIRSAENIDWNQVVDQLIEQFKVQIYKQGKDVVPLPPINESFERRFVITVRGRLEATGGHIGNMSSVHRVGAVEVSKSHPLTITARLRFSALNIHYSHFQARVLSLNPSGQINATVAENEFLLKVRLDADKTGCKLVYEDVQVMEISDIKVRITGMNVLNKLASVIASRAAKSMRQTIAVSMERLLDEELADIFNNTQLDCSS